jgi:hypothetical protein
MQTAWTVLSTVAAALGLAFFLPVSASAGTITIVDGTNDTISFTTDGAATTARLVTTNCPGAESSSCFFAIVAPTLTASTTEDNIFVSLLEPQQTFASDNLQRVDVGGGVRSVWGFASDAEGGISPLANAFTLTENGRPQLVVTLTYLNVAGGVVGTDQIFIQSDLETVGTPEPASASLLLLGGGILVAAGRLRKRVRG